MFQKETFNKAQQESEELARIALRLIPETWGEDVKSFGDLVGIVKDGLFLTGTIDGVGTKILIAEKLNSYYQLGVDAVYSNVNDLVRFGVEPKMAFPIISLGSKQEDKMRDLAFGITCATREVGVSIIGGETEVLRRVFATPKRINVAVAIFGWNETSKLITRENLKSGDVLFGLPSSGLHTNGFSEIIKKLHKIDFNKLLLPNSQFSANTVGRWLTEPTKNYLPVMTMLRNHNIKIKAAEAVTGGGFTERLSKLLANTNLRVDFEENSWTQPPIFQYLQDKFKWSTEKMYQTFNMGIGMFLIVAKSGVKRVFDVAEEEKMTIFQIGELK